MKTSFIPPRRALCGRRSTGQALVEFAIVAPVFFLLLFAIIEAGRFILYYETLNNATREGARYAIVNGANSLTCPTGPPAPKSVACDPTGAHVVQRVKDAAFNVMGTGVTVTVFATYTYHALVPLVPLPPITITAESSLVINN
jgi:TadE-like protein